MKPINIVYSTIFTLVFFIASFNIYGQNTKTPKNQTIILSSNRDTPAWINTWDSLATVWIDIKGSKAEKVGAATSHYNCHSYAWHISDGGDDEDAWMNGDILGNPNVAKYWTNDAYSTTNSTYKGGYKKVYYGEDADHSAILVGPGRVISKWAEWGLFEHNLADCPFSDGATYTYYSIPLNGDDIVCNSETFSTININGATYSWSSSRVSISGSGNSVNANKTGNGEGYIQVDISSPYSGTTITSEKIDFWAGAPDPDDFEVYIEELYGNPVPGSPDGPFEVCEGERYWICFYPYFLFDDQGITDVEFDFTFDYDVLDEGDDYIEIEINDPPDGEEGEVYITSTCGGYSTFKFLDFEEGSCGRSMMVITPNPGSGETTIAIQTSVTGEPLKSAANKPVINGNTEWEFEIYSPTLNLKQKKTKLSTKIQTQGWQEGVYIVRATIKQKDKPEEIVNGKLVVKR
jgi:hypothetical protein